MKILIVEDEKQFQKMLTSVFKANGFETISAFDGKQAVQIAEEEVPDVVLLDLILPKKDGFFVIREMKKNPHLADIPIIVLTNLEDSRSMEEVVSFGVYTYLVKANYTLNEVVEKAKEALKIKNED